MNAAEIARKYAYARTGYELVAYREVALPLFRVDCTMLVLEQKAVPPIQEYVLRSVASGITDLRSIGGLLGIEEAVVRTATAELLRGDNLVLGAAGAGREHGLSLTEKGLVAAKEATETQAIERELRVWIDGLTREILSVTGRGLDAFPAAEARHRGLVEIAASPRRRPQLQEIPFETVRAVIARESAGRRGRREVIGIVGMGKARRYAREGVALAYHRMGEPPVISLIVGAEPSEAHDAAFSRARERSAKRLTPERWSSAHELIGDQLPDELPAPPEATEEAERLQLEHDDAMREGDELRAATRRAERDELSELQGRLVEAEQRERELRAALENISVRQVPVYEHREYLDRALTEAKTRVLIVSPWIRYEVVDNQLISRFRKLLDRGVELWIGYGIAKRGGYRPGKKGEADREAEKALRRLGDDYATFRMKRLGDTHAKVLVCDSRFSIITSFNWLSFRGDAQLEFRDERGYYVGLGDKVDEVFESYRGRMDESGAG